MDYSSSRNSSKPHLSNPELLLLEIVHSKGEITGYATNQLIQQGDYKYWLKAGKTSVYLGIDKLRQKKLIATFFNPEKRGKGPIPQKITITRKGFETLKNEIFHALASSQECDIRFRLGIEGMALLSKNEIGEALEKRLHCLKDRVNTFTVYLKNEKAQHRQLLLQHSLAALKYELNFLDSLVKNKNSILSPQNS